MFATKKELSRSRTAIIIAVHVFALCTAGASAYVAFADEPRTPPEAVPTTMAPIDLEHAFWACDYMGTKYGVHTAPVGFCSEVTAELKQQKFGGDFLQMLEWWRQNKPAQHSRMQSALVTSVSMQ